MRHLISLVLGVILAPLIYILAGISQAKLDEGIRSGHTLSSALGVALLCGLAAGGLYALLVLARISPVGAVVAGLIYMGASGWLAFASANFFSTLPKSVLGVNGALTGQAGALTLVASVPLLCTVFSPRRWRSGVQSGSTGFDAAPSYGTVTTTAAPVYQPSTSYSPSYQSSTASSPYTPSSYTTPSYSSGDTTLSSPKWDPDES